MDWLKDKKNQPIVAAVAAVIIIGVIVFMYMSLTGGGSDSSSSSDTMAAAPSGTGTPGAPMGVPASQPNAAAPATSSPAPSAQPAAAAGANAPTAIAPMENWRNDPFEPIGYKRPKTVKKPVPHIPDFPFITLPHPVGPGQIPDQPETPQPSRRMAGLLLNGRVYAIIETNGTTEIVQPGDTLADRLAIVERIDQDKVVLKTTTGSKARYITVRMAAAPQTDSSMSGSSGTSAGGAVGAPLGRTGVPMLPPTMGRRNM